VTVKRRSNIRKEASLRLSSLSKLKVLCVTRYRRFSFLVDLCNLVTCVYWALVSSVWISRKWSAQTKARTPARPPVGPAPRARRPRRTDSGTGGELCSCHHSSSNFDTGVSERKCPSVCSYFPHNPTCPAPKHLWHNFVAKHVPSLRPSQRTIHFSSPNMLGCSTFPAAC